MEAVVGSGGTAVVYRVRHNSLHTLHALKVLTISSTAIRQRMLREGRVQASLRHPNVVAVYDVLDLDGAPGLLMEHIAGPSLEVALEKHRFTLADAESLFLGILAGVHQAHQHGLVHRDLKPANVLLARTAQGYVPKVTDFGIAKIVVGDTLDGSNTRAGIAMGTPQYMAPEQIRDARTVDQRADIFSLGCLLYELVTHRRAFPQKDVVGIYNAVTDGTYVAPSVLTPDLPRRLESAIRGALEVDRDRRIPDTRTLYEVVMGTRPWDMSVTPAPAPVALEAADPTMPPAAAITGLPILDELTESDDLAPDDLATDQRSGTLGNEPSLATYSDDVEPVVLERTRHPAATALLVLAATAVVVALLLPRDPATPEPPPTLSAPAVAQEPAPTRAPVPDPTPPEAPSVTVVSPPAPIATPARPTTAAPARTTTPPAKPTPAPQQVAAPPPAAAPAPTPAAPTTRVVKILSSPPVASIFVDGAPAGRTPAKLELTPGEHAIRLVIGDDEGRFSVPVASRDDQRWCYDFGDGSVTMGSCTR